MPDLPSLTAFLDTRPQSLARGPVALILAEDGCELAASVAHHLQAGFGSVILCLPGGLEPPADAGPALIAVRHDPRGPGAVPAAINALIAACPAGTWIYWGFNAEFLLHPFCESRNIRELVAFHAEERREAMMATVIDLYAADLSRHPDGVDLARPRFDAAGYYALDRRDEAGAILARQQEVFGGLRWRFDDFVPADGRRIDRVALFRSRPGLTVSAGLRFSDPEYNTANCPWHRNLTACVMSFRAAKALRANPASRDRIAGFDWWGAVGFDWSSQQLMDLGLMEPGQWF